MNTFQKLKWLEAKALNKNEAQRIKGGFGFISNPRIRRKKTGDAEYNKS